MVLDVAAPAPDLLNNRLPGRSEVLAHTVTIDPARWDRLLREHGLDAAADALQADVLEGRRHLSRQDVLSIGGADVSPERAELLFCASLAWGLGLKARRLETRLASYAGARKDALPRLVAAWSAVRDGHTPEQCYQHLLTTNGRATVPWFGAAFATKYLYFATGPDVNPACLILDAVVAASLDAVGVWPGAPTHAWWPSTYARYCALMAGWAREMPGEGSEVFADQVEMTLFQLSRTGGAKVFRS